MLCPTATAARLAPIVCANVDTAHPDTSGYERWYAPPEPVPSSHADWLDASARSGACLHFLVFPGHIPAQEARWAASGKRERSSPTESTQQMERVPTDSRDLF